jgi:hypothetical protein
MLQAEYNYPAIVGKLIGATVHNVAVPSQGLIKNFDTSQDWYGRTIPAIITDINTRSANHEFDNTVLITGGWAYNDTAEYSALDFGDPYAEIPSSNNNITTWLGHYARIMRVLQEAAPNALVVLITGFGYTTETVGHKTDNQFTHQYTFADGTKTVKEMYDALERMANHNGFCCINQSKGSAINKINGNTLLFDNIHPSQDGYKVYGNFIASRVVALFKNVLL